MQTTTQASLLAALFSLAAMPAVNAQTLLADYQFNDTLASAVGSAADLELIGAPTFESESVDGEARRVLSFVEGDGCRLLNASQTLGDAYTIVVLFRFDSISSWRRVLDFRNRKTDWGLYSYVGNLNFYNVLTGSGGAIQPGVYVQIALSRNEQGTVRGYVNGVPEIDFADTGSDATLDVDDILSFFQDDLSISNENSSGAVSRIRIWDDALPAVALAVLDRAPGITATPAPVISSALEVSLVSGEELNYSTTASNDPVAFSATNLESWMMFDPATGVLTGVADTPGVYDLGLSAFNASGSDIETLRIIVTPTDGSTLGFSVGSVRVSETAGTIEITVFRQGDPTGLASVAYATGNGTATAGVHFSAVADTLSFGDGETEKTIVIDLTYVLSADPDVEFVLNLSSPVNATIGEPTQLRIVIEDVPYSISGVEVFPADEVVSATEIKWQSLLGVSYRVVRSEDLDFQNSTIVQDSIIGTGGEMKVSDEITVPKRFYRVEVE